MLSMSLGSRGRSIASVALAVAAFGAGSGLAASSASAAAPASAKIEKVIAKGGSSKQAASKQSLKSVKRQLARAGLQASKAPASKKMRRGCLYTFYYDGVLAECGNGGFVDVWADVYGDGFGWLYLGWY